MQIDKFYKQNGYKVADDFISRYKINERKNTMTIYYANGTEKEESYTLNLEKETLSTMMKQTIEFKNSELYSLLKSYAYTVAYDNTDKGFIYYLKAYRQMIINNQYYNFKILDYFLYNKEEIERFKKCFDYPISSSFHISKKTHKFIRKSKSGYMPIITINNIERLKDRDIYNIKATSSSYEEKPVVYTSRSLV